MEKMPQRGTHSSRRSEKLNFLKRNVERNRNEIEARKKIRFRAPGQKKKQTKTIQEKIIIMKKKKKKNERK